MTFKYFKGPFDQMAELFLEKYDCAICGKNDYCFDLEYATTSFFGQDDKEGKPGCYNCLREGRFEFWHDTEYGMLDENGLQKVYNSHMDNPPLISTDRLTELRRTPQIASIQQELWLTHCDDFMIFKGIWKPEDFYINSKDGDGRALFMEMTNEDINHLWDDYLPENTTILSEWFAFYYAFECSHCGQMRGNWDCD